MIYDIILKTLSKNMAQIAKLMKTLPEQCRLVGKERRRYGRIFATTDQKTLDLFENIFEKTVKLYM
jgi:hypothetical protein